MKYLITYASRRQGASDWDFVMDVTGLRPIEWLASVQDYPEAYVLINSEEITDEEAIRYDGQFKGM